MKKKNIRLVRQEDDTGCGIACVAMVADLPYQKVKDVLMELKGWKKPDRQLYTRAKTHLDPLLKKLGIQFELKKSRGWDDIQGVCLLGVNRDEGYFHWVVVIKDSGRFLILDPAYGEVIQWVKPGRKKYVHSTKKSTHVYLPISVRNIKI